MNLKLRQKIERTITFLPAGEQPPPPIAYWATRPYHERLVEVFIIVSGGRETYMELIEDIAGHHFWLGKPPWTIGFIGHPTGIEFETCYATREESELEGVTIPFLSQEHFMPTNWPWDVHKTWRMWTIYAVCRVTDADHVNANEPFPITITG